MDGSEVPVGGVEAAARGEGFDVVEAVREACRRLIELEAAGRLDPPTGTVHERAKTSKTRSAKAAAHLSWTAVHDRCPGEGGAE